MFDSKTFPLILVREIGYLFILKKKVADIPMLR